MSMADRSAAYDLLEGFDLSSEFKQAAPPYLQQDPPTYKLRPVRYLQSLLSPPLTMGSPSQHPPRGHRLRAIAGELPPGAGPEDSSKSSL